MANTRPLSYTRNIRPFQKSRCRKGTRKCGMKCVSIRRRHSKRKLERCQNGYMRCVNHTCQQKLR